MEENVFPSVSCINLPNIGMQISLAFSSIPHKRNAFKPLSDNAKLIDLPADMSVVLKSGLLSYKSTLKPLCASLKASKLPHKPAPIISTLSFLFIN